MSYIGLEKHLDEIINIYQNNLINEVAQINLENSDFILKTPEKIFIQTINDDAFNYDPFLFIRAEVVNTDSIGPASAIQVQFHVTCIFEAGNSTQEWRKSFRYMRAISNVAHRNFQTELLSNKMKINQHTPDAFQDEEGTSLVCGISLNMNIYN